MAEKRIRQRRTYVAASKFPFTDSSGCVVPFDRSRIADRRLNDLALKEPGINRIKQKRVN
ncbi:MAG: hypothetical protein OEV12_02495 [Gammaproteobacteria bacterium]|nr:hypothetical protein [Gammaproteobacteria bacterium]MDH3887719.1 hypothetical protein [Gammaproteobacteria bacterium]MDH3934628.1 hypothetical protein [Gammaproteobacteria bacterium]MDH3985267.1 hypothetical protein [Gammaproteobacteria bacterium]